MRWIRDTLTVAACLAVLVMMAGCGELRASGTRIRAGAISIDDTKDNDVELIGSYNPETGLIDIKKFTLRNNASDPNKTLPPIVIANAEYRRAVNEGVIGETNAIFGGVSSLITAGTPLLAARQQAKNQQQILEATQPSLVHEIVNGVMGGKLSLPGLGSSGLISPEELAQVKAMLVRIQQDIAAAQAAEAARQAREEAIRKLEEEAATSQPDAVGTSSGGAVSVAANRGARL